MGQNMPLMRVCDSSARIWGAAGKAEKGCWHPGSWKYCRGLKAVLQHLQNFAQTNNPLVGFSGLFRLYTVVVLVCDTAMSLLSCILRTPPKVQNGETPPLVVLCLGCCSIQGWTPGTSRSLLLQCYSPEPFTSPETSPGKGVLLAQDPFSDNIIIFQCQSSLGQKKLRNSYSLLHYTVQIQPPWLSSSLSSFYLWKLKK